MSKIIIYTDSVKYLDKRFFAIKVLFNKKENHSIMEIVTNEKQDYLKTLLLN